MDIAWFVVLSAFIFCIGAAGVLTRRNPLVVLLCLELMLNAGNLALVAFSRMHGGEAGQVFALIVMVIAACEVVIGLGIIVAMYRARLPIDVDEMSELRGMSATTYGWLILAFPLVGLLVISFGWRVLPGRTPGWIASGAIGLAFLSAVAAAFDLDDRPEDARALVDTAYTYAATGDFRVDMAILVDPLAIFMCMVVSGVSFLIHVYSVAYMTGDRGYARYFAYLNFFVFSMLLLILAANFVLLIVGWAFVGAASYLLISFWYRRDTATSAGIKAFVINVIGDVGLVIAAFLILDKTGSLDYLTVFSVAGDTFTENDGTVVAICLLLLVGAFAKSAQLPLHTWLPDAMEGPTPVSALIHAATMVTAGVYLIARTHVLFELAPIAADLGAIIGTATLVFAASVAVTVTDLKRVIAYSTISQIGYMVLGVSAAAYSAGMFHLMTHAFFKALLFMCAGSVIAAMAGSQDLDKMGGFRKAMPFTFLAFVIGALALSGFPLTSGFFSKDEILAYTINRGGGFVVLGVFGYLAAGLTAFYAFRLVFRVFYGEPVKEARELESGGLAHHEPANPLTGESEDTDVGFPGPEHHVAERALPMRVAMVQLAFLALVAGFLQVPGVTDAIGHFLEPSFADSRFAHTEPSESAELSGLLIGGIVSIVGIAAAYHVYVRRPGLSRSIQARFAGLHGFLVNKWYFDELFDLVIVRPVAAAGSFGRRVIETDFVQGTIVGGATGAVRAGTSMARAVQTGYIRAYAMLLLAGLAALVLYFLLSSS